MGFPKWELAELLDSHSRLGRLVPGGRITVPERTKLSPDRSEITWDGGPADATVRVRHTQADHRMLKAFVQLWKQKPESILRYAQRWGVLYLDKDGRPCQTVGPFERRESLEAWRYFSRRAHAVLNIASNLKLGKLGEISDWEALRGTARWTGKFFQEMDRYAPFEQSMIPLIEYPFDRDREETHVNKNYVRSVTGEIALLSIEATFWLKLTRVGFRVGFTGSGMRPVIDYNDCMLAAIALQLALVLGEVETLFTCDGCHLPYVRTRRSPKDGQANFCENCGRPEAMKRADKKRRGKMAEARRLAREGVSLQEIVTRVDSKPGTVTRWIRKEIMIESTPSKDLRQPNASG